MTVKFRHLVMLTMLAALVCACLWYFPRQSSPATDRLQTVPPSAATAPAPRDVAEKTDPSRARVSTVGSAASLPHSTANSASPVTPAESVKGTDATLAYAKRERWRTTPIPCWGLRGTAPEDFMVEADTRILTSGKSSVSIASRGESQGWGTLYQFADAQAMRGRRVEFSADVRTMAVTRGASLFVRVDDAQGKTLALDNMWMSLDTNYRDGRLVNRTITGDTDWSTEHIVLDIPDQAHAISFGVNLSGGGTLWIDNAQLELVSEDTPVTGFVQTPEMLRHTAPFPLLEPPQQPANLDFERDAVNACGVQR
jgi:hypothetical protein